MSGQGMSRKHWRIGVAGLGTVGTGLLKFVSERPDFAPAGGRVTVTGVSARSRSRPREFDISGLAARHRDLRFVELGRSCVSPAYRNKRTVELLWQGIWSYVRQHRLDVMIGCASLNGTDPDRLALPLSFLHHFAAAPESWRAGPQPSRRIEMNRIARHLIDHKAALRELPPLIKGYLRLGAFVGDGAVIDDQFGTTDVLVVLPVSAINARHIRHFGADASRHAA